MWITTDDDWFEGRDGSSVVDWTDEAVIAAWCRRYDTDRERVLAAVDAVGPMPRAVRYHLRSASKPTKGPRPVRRAEAPRAASTALAERVQEDHRRPRPPDKGHG